jgi:hypothetical protein
MLARLVDNANLVYLVLGLVALGLAVKGWLDRRVKTLVLAVGVVGLMVLFWCMTLIVPTDRKQIQANLWSMAQAVLDQKPDDLTKHLARDFRFKDLDREALGNAVARASRTYKVESINLWEFDVKSQTDDKAEIWFRCVAHGQTGGTFLAICKAHFVKEDDQWKLERAAFFQPVANTDQEIALPIGR